MKKIKFDNWRKYGFEFLSIFIAVVSAFALNNWNENRRDALSENKILTEISNGLEKDLSDIKLNENGHRDGISACNFFRKAFTGKNINADSLMYHYLKLTRDFVSIQNIAGYETLKSKGLELINNDSLRLQIITLYEYDYNTLRKLEEEYSEMQFQENYFKDINEELAPHFKIDSLGNVNGIDLPLKIQENKRNKLLIYLWKIQENRNFILEYYSEIEEKIDKVRKNINNEIKH
ncbi:hypothetical protein [Marinifilum fragile]|uniref:hypothetical protein n=1 Tax=Marinifilum fragile TaxID=570161 RepID=UPI0006CF2B1C|nr:hypothetical protein [Marinifilum fragile]